MASKTGKKTAAKKPLPLNTDAALFDSMLSKLEVMLVPPIDDRKRLLAQVAGAVAAGLVTSPSPMIATSAAMATASLDIAEQILMQAGIVEKPATSQAA